MPYEPGVIVPAPVADARSMDGAGEAAAEFAPVELAAVHVPQSMQNMRLGRFAAPQFQHSTVDDGAGAAERTGSRGAGAGAGCMGAPESSRDPEADDTSESHSPQNAVTASTGAPHVGQADRWGTRGIIGRPAQGVNEQTCVASKYQNDSTTGRCKAFGVLFATTTLDARRTSLE